MKKVKLKANILFSGIGTQERGFEDSGLFDIEVVTTADISKEAVLSYAAIHKGLTNEMVKNYKDYPSRDEMSKELSRIRLGYDISKNKEYDWNRLIRSKTLKLETYWLANKLCKNLGDISLIKTLPYADLWTISFCCQDISVSGKQLGFKEGSGTRSSTLWKCIDLLKQAKSKGEIPKYLLFENVKNLLGKNFISDFNRLLDVLDKIGFNSYYKVLNSKDFGIPQNRERVFVLCINKCIDTKTFTFPQGKDIGIRLKDVLEKYVEDKYYVSNTAPIRFKVLDTSSNKFVKSEKTKADSRYTFYNLESYIDLINTTDYKQDELVLTNTTKQIGNLNNVDKNYQTDRIWDIDYISPTLTTNVGGSHQPKIFVPPLIRKLTPKEYWRLMGLNDIDIEKCISLGLSDNSLYTLAGNSIVTNCVRIIAESLYNSQYSEKFDILNYKERTIKNYAI